MKKLPSLFFIFVGVIAVIGSCKKKKETKEVENIDCSTINAAYSANVKFIVNGNCLSSGCHNSGSANGDFTTYAGLKAKADNGSLNNRVLEQKTMPPSGALSTDNLKIIKCWISSSSPNN